jgi:hypothetical protein
MDVVRVRLLVRRANLVELCASCRITSTPTRQS